jgi:hypothetical protein
MHLEPVKYKTGDLTQFNNVLKQMEFYGFSPITSQLLAMKSSLHGMDIALSKINKVKIRNKSSESSHRAALVHISTLI